MTPSGFTPKMFHEKPKHSNCKGSKHISSRLSSVGHTTHIQITSYSRQDFYFEHLNYNVSSLFHNILFQYCKIDGIVTSILNICSYLAIYTP